MKTLFILTLIIVLNLICCEAGKNKNKTKKVEKKNNVSLVNKPEVLPPSLLNDPSIKQTYNILKNNLDDWTGASDLKNYVEHPEEVEEYDAMINEAKENLLKENIMDYFFKQINRALQGRKLRYVRLIGPGSMNSHLNHHKYMEGNKGKIMKNALLLLQNTPKSSENYLYLYNKIIQQRAVYQFAVQLLTIEHFNRLQNQENKEETNKDKNKGKSVASSSENISEKIIGTFEDLFVNEKEKEYIEKIHKITVINPIKKDKNTNLNLYNIPKIVDNIKDDEVTLVLLFQCPIEMTFNLIKSYENKQFAKNLILVEGAIMNEYINNRNNQQNSLVNQIKDLAQLDAFPFPISKLATDQFANYPTCLYFKDLREIKE